MSPDREVMTVAEAADFLRFSISTMHQRKDIPRHRVPGSREYRYIRSELLSWLRGNEPMGAIDATAAMDAAVAASSVRLAAQPIVDNSSRPLYHRSTRYR